MKSVGCPAEDDSKDEQSCDLKDDSEKYLAFDSGQPGQSQGKSRQSKKKFGLVLDFFRNILSPSFSIGRSISLSISRSILRRPINN